MIPRDPLPGEGLLTLRSEALGFVRSNMTLEEMVSELFIAHRAAVYRFVLTILEDAAESEDVTQESFIRFYLCLKNNEKVEHARSWILRVARNLAVSRLRNRRLAATSTSWEELCALRPDPILDPEQQMQRLECYGWLHVAISRLPVLQRQCVLLRADGLRYREIAEILSVSVSTVLESVRRALQKLKEQRHV